MDCIAYEVAKSRTRLSDFHYYVLHTEGGTKDEDLQARQSFSLQNLWFSGAMVYACEMVHDWVIQNKVSRERTMCGIMIALDCFIEEIGFGTELCG